MSSPNNTTWASPFCSTAVPVLRPAHLLTIRSAASHLLFPTCLTPARASQHISPTSPLAVAPLQADLHYLAHSQVTTLQQFSGHSVRVRAHV